MIKGFRLFFVHILVLLNRKSINEYTSIKEHQGNCINNLNLNLFLDRGGVNILGTAAWRLVL